MRNSFERESAICCNTPNILFITHILEQVDETIGEVFLLIAIFFRSILIDFRHKHSEYYLLRSPAQIRCELWPHLYKLFSRMRCILHIFRFCCCCTRLFALVYAAVYLYRNIKYQSSSTYVNIMNEKRQLLDRAKVYHCRS